MVRKEVKRIGWVRIDQLHIGIVHRQLAKPQHTAAIRHVIARGLPAWFFRAVPNVWMISSPWMLTAVIWPRITGGGSIWAASSMISFPSTVTPLVLLVLTSLAISRPKSFMMPLTGKCAAFTFVG